MHDEDSVDLLPWEPLLGPMFEQAPGFMALLEGPRHVFRLANRSYRQLVGDRPLANRAVREAFPELSGSGFFELLDRAFETGVPYIGRPVPLQLGEAKGGAVSEHYIDFVYQPFVAPDGEVLGIFCQGHEVTDRVMAERLLKARADEMSLERQVFDTALSFSEDFNYVFETSGRFSYVNKPLLDLWGMTLEQAKGKTFRDLPYERDLADRLQQQIEQVVRTASQVRDETFYRGPTGKAGWYEYIFNPVFDSSGAVVSVAGSTRDITSRIENEQHVARLMESEHLARNEAERAGRAKDEFLATLSHELRTPLNSIIGWAQMLKSGRLPEDKARQAIDRIIHNGRAQAQLISDLLDVNSIAAGKMRLRLERLPLSHPLDAALDSVMPEATMKGVTVIRPTVDAELKAECDPDRLQQVFWNLLTNAIKFTPAGGTISMAVESDNSWVSIAIADSGSGIEPEFLPRLFERFSQADSSTTRKYSGLGLGLSICKTLVELHGGTIGAESPGPEQGATFLVTLPLAAAIDQAEPSMWQSDYAVLPPPADASHLQDLRVLVVDDQEEGRSFIRDLFKQYGANVSEADSADSALVALANETFGLIICDVGMPLKDGYSMIREARSSPALLCRTPAIALTAFAAPEDELAALEAGFDVHLGKPVDPATIIRISVRAVQNGTRRVDESRRGAVAATLTNARSLPERTWKKQPSWSRRWDASASSR